MGDRGGQTHGIALMENWLRMEILSFITRRTHDRGTQDPPSNLNSLTVIRLISLKLVETILRYANFEIDPPTRGRVERKDVLHSKNQFLLRSKKQFLLRSKTLFFAFVARFIVLSNCVHQSAIMKQLSV